MRFAQESKNKTKYPNMHFIFCLNIDAYNSFVKLELNYCDGTGDIYNGSYSAQA